MRTRSHIFLGFALVLLPPLISAFWAYRAGHRVHERIDHLSSSLFPIQEITNNITLRINDLKDAFVETASYPDEEGYDRTRALVRELDREFRQLLALSDDPRVVALHGLTRDYCNKGLDLIRSIMEGDEHLLMTKGAEISEIAAELLAEIKNYRTEKNLEFSRGLALVNQTADRIRIITGLTSVTALLFGGLLAFWLSRWFSQTSLELQATHTSLELRFREISETNALLEKEVAERKRAEEAARKSLKFEEALSQVSKLFTSTYAPNLRQVVRILGQVVKANMSFLGLIRGSGRMVEKLVEWSDGASPAHFPDIMDLDLHQFPNWFEALSMGRQIAVEDLGTLSEQAEGERQFVRSLGIRSILLMPITSKEEMFWGYMGYAQLHESRAWSEEDIRILQVGCEMLSNILARKKAEEKLKYDAFHDNLTGLPNRALVMERLSHALTRLDRHPGEVFAVLFIDLDRFKPINDNLGHHVGDQLLIEVGRRLQECVRQMDTVGRLGGDEFITILEELDVVEEVKAVAERVLGRLSEPFTLEGQKAYISCSIGISVVDKRYDNAEDILRDADIAMYRAKLKGKSRYVLFDKTMQTHTLSTFKLESELRHALERQEFALHYQPIVCFNTGAILGFETLLRWNHHSMGLVAPAEFIPIAEETGAMVELGAWVLRTACHQTQIWRREGHESLSIAVNVSARQFYEEGLSRLINDILTETCLPASYLKLELTESILMENVDGNIQMLHELKKLGVQILIDDFGTGYSSLSYLKRFPLNTLKIDRSFIKDIPDDADDTAITSTIIAMARSLNLGVIAEGVESLEQLAFLRESGCRKGQGYLFSKPLPVEEATQFLREPKLKQLNRFLEKQG